MRLSQLAFATGILILTGLARPAAAVEVSYLFELSDFNGAVPYGDVNLHADRSSDELYAAVGNEVRIFNASGMETYRFELDAALGTIFALAVDAEGDILLLTLDLSDKGRLPDWSITRCNYRGEPIDRLQVTGLPQQFDDFVPNVMVYREGSFVLASQAQLRVAVADRSGRFQAGYDLAELLDIPDGKRGDNDMRGFSVDREGNMLFTIPVLFKVFVVSTAGEVQAFGRPGSIPGSFGIVADVVADDQGHLLVADKLRRVVMVFDRDYEFLTEFGAGETGRIWLAQPNHLTTGNGGRVYVTQAGDKGVAVFRLSSGGEVIRWEAGPQPRGGAVESGAVSSQPGQAATDEVSVAGQPMSPPVARAHGQWTGAADSADPRTIGMPEAQGGNRQ